MDSYTNTVVAFDNYSEAHGSLPHQIAIVSAADKGRALALRKFPSGSEEIVVFAHNDLLPSIKVGDLVKFDHTQYGALIIDFAHGHHKW